jgi:hypothetical protein
MRRLDVEYVLGVLEWALVAQTGVDPRFRPEKKKGNFVRVDFQNLAGDFDGSFVAPRLIRTLRRKQSGSEQPVGVLHRPPKGPLCRASLATIGEGASVEIQDLGIVGLILEQDPHHFESRFAISGSDDPSRFLDRRIGLEAADQNDRNNEKESGEDPSGTVKGRMIFRSRMSTGP